MSGCINDMHVHTKFSYDSQTEMSEYCEAAILNGIKRICFTDHVDFNPNDDGYHYYNAVAFFKEYNNCLKRYGDTLEILCGIEFAEPHLYQNEFLILSKFDYDFILGSNHYWYRDMFPSTMLKENVPVETCFEKYWETIYQSVEFGKFNSLAHIDFPKRYYGKTIVDKNKVVEIFKLLISKSICLEINTSPLRKGLSQTLPDDDILCLYQSCGGKYITVGSDAHSADELAADIVYAKTLIKKYDFTEVYFKNRVMHNA